MERDELVARHPVLFHVAAAESWPSIQAHGLLSAERLLALHDVHAPTRDALLTRPRRRTHLLQDAGRGVACAAEHRKISARDPSEGRDAEPVVAMGDRSMRRTYDGGVRLLAAAPRRRAARSEDKGGEGG